MSSDVLPERIKTKNLFAGNTELSGVIPLARMPRLSNYLTSDEGQVKVNLLFRLDEEGRREVAGNLETTLKMVCQRCLGETSLAIRSDLQLFVVVSDQEAEALDSLEDCLQVEGETVPVWEMVEDEVILSLPIVAYHNRTDCNERLNTIRSDVEAGGPEESANPFAELAGLKEKLKTNQDS